MAQAADQTIHFRYPRAAFKRGPLWGVHVSSCQSQAPEFMEAPDSSPASSRLRRSGDKPNCSPDRARRALSRARADHLGTPCATLLNHAAVAGDFGLLHCPTAEPPNVPARRRRRRVHSHGRLGAHTRQRGWPRRKDRARGGCSSHNALSRFFWSRSATRHRSRHLSSPRASMTSRSLPRALRLA